MDSGLEERILPSIRRLQMLLIYRKGGVDNLETCGQIACEVGRPRKNRCMDGYISGQTQGSAPTTPFALKYPGCSDVERD